MLPACYCKSFLQAVGIVLLKIYGKLLTKLFAITELFLASSFSLLLISWPFFYFIFFGALFSSRVQKIP